MVLAEAPFGDDDTMQWSRMTLTSWGAPFAEICEAAAEVPRSTTRMTELMPRFSFDLSIYLEDTG